MQAAFVSSNRARVGAALATLVLVAALPAGAGADTVTPRPAKPQPVVPRTIPAPPPQPESAPGPPGEAIPNATTRPEATAPPEVEYPAPNPVPIPNMRPPTSLRDQGALGSDLADLLMRTGEQWLFDPVGPILLPATMLAQSDSSSNPQPLVDIPMEMDLLPMPRALKTLAGVWLVEGAIGAASKRAAAAACAQPKVDDRGVSYCPK